MLKVLLTLVALSCLVSCASSGDRVHDSPASTGERVHYLDRGEDA